MIRLVLGRAGSGKTTRIMHEIKERVLHGNRATLIVPEQYSHSAERQLLKIAGDSLSLHGEVLSFRRLSSRIFEELSVGLPSLESGGSLLILYQALRAVSGSLEIYGDTPGRLQFLSALQSTVTELRNSGVTPRELSDAAGSDGATSKKLRDLALIMESYVTQLEGSGIYDSRSALERTAALVAKSSYAGAVLYFDGFNDFTEPEMQIIRALAQTDAELCFCLTAEHLESDSDAFRLPCETTNSLIMLAGENLTKCKVDYVEGRPKRPPELLHMEAELFGDQAAFEGDCEAIELFFAHDINSECEYAAALVKRLVRNGYRWGDIAVMSHGNSAYLKLCESVFLRHGIPSFQSGRDDILSKPPVRLMLGALELLYSRWEYEDVFKYLKTGLSGIDSMQLDKLEGFVFRRGIRGKQWHQEEPWHEAPPEIDALRREIVSPLAKLKNTLKKSVTGGEMLRSLYAFLEDISLPESLKARSEQLCQSGHDRFSDEYLQLWNIITDALDQMYIVTGNIRMTVSEFTNLLKLLLSCYSVGVIPVALDRVTIGDMSMSRRRDVRALIVLGASDGNIPRAFEQSGVLSARERDSLAKTLKLPHFDASEKLLSREMNIIYSALTMPSEYLAVIYNGAGGSRPAFIINRLEHMFSLSTQTIPNAELLSRDELLLSQKTVVPPDRGALSAELAESLYGSRLTLSPTRVEKYASCRFAFFMQNGLKAKPVKAESFDAPESGTFIHYVLERTASEIRRLGGFKSVTEREVRLLTRRFTSEFIADNYPDFGSKSERFRYLLRRLSSDAERITLDLLGELSDSSFEPLRFEARFNADIPDADLAVAGVIDRVDGWNGNGKLYLRVSDYKTGRRTFSLSDVFYGLGMQMLIYLYALSLENGSSALPAGALYTPARDEIYSARRNEPDAKITAELSKTLRRSGLLLADPEVIDALEGGSEKLYLPVRVSGGGYSGDSLVTLEQFGMLSTHVQKKLSEMAGEIRSGSTAADPYAKSAEDHACKYCDYASACGFGALPDDKFRALKKLRADDFWAAIEKEAD